MRKPGAIMAAGALAFVATSAQAGPIRPGETSGFDLGLMGPKVPAVLKAAKDAPYAPPPAQDCEAIAEEIQRLNKVLGPDADAPGEKATMEKRAGKFLTNTIRGFIPHRDVVRFVTGAGRKEKALTDAAMAGWARRGFLKGLQTSLACPTASDASPLADPGQTVDASTAAAAPAHALPAAAQTTTGPAPADAGAGPVVKLAPIPQPVLIRTAAPLIEIAPEATLSR